MRQFIKQSQTDEVGREIGFDMYRFNIPLTEMENYSAVQEGFQTAQIQDVSRVARPTIFGRKLIQIKMRAYRKGIAVEISESDLEAAYNDCRGLCPVTGREMTVAKILDTDWSVDRLDNERGYLPDNIVIMSSMANQAKGDITLHDLIMYCMGGKVPEACLVRFKQKSRRFWRQMLNAYYKKMTSFLFGKVLQELCSHPDQRFSILSALNIHLFQIVSEPTLKEVERLWRACPFLCVYLRDRTINKGDMAKLRKSAVNAIRVSGYSEQAIDFDAVFNISVKFALAPRSVNIVNMLMERWEKEIDDDEKRRTVMLAVLIEDSVQG